MKALVLRAKDELHVAELADPVPSKGEVLIEVKAAALNHRDVWIKIGQYAGIVYPSILGSDGAGVVVGLGEDVDKGWLGREVIVNPSYSWGDDLRHQGPNFSILGLPLPGTLATRLVAPVKQLGVKPASWSFEEAAALPLAGLTAFRALFSRAELLRGERVLINGIGGGVAVFALQFAVAAGAEAWVTSSSQEKIARAVSLGAKGGFDYNTPDWAAEAVRVTGGFDVIVDSAGGPGFESLLDAARQGGRIVNYGATRGVVSNFPLRKVFWKQLSILGTTMGSPSDWETMVSFVTKKGIRPVVGETHPFEAAEVAFKAMEASTQFGKIVVRVG